MLKKSNIKTFVFKLRGKCLTVRCTVLRFLQFSLPIPSHKQTFIQYIHPAPNPSISTLSMQLLMDFQSVFKRYNLV